MSASISTAPSSDLSAMPAEPEEDSDCKYESLVELRTSQGEIHPCCSNSFDGDENCGDDDKHSQGEFVEQGGHAQGNAEIMQEDQLVKIVEDEIEEYIQREVESDTRVERRSTRPR